MDYYKLTYCCFLETNEKVNFSSTEGLRITRRTLCHNISDKSLSLFVRVGTNRGDIYFDCEGVEWDGEPLKLCSIYDIKFTIWRTVCTP